MTKGRYFCFMPTLAEEDYIKAFYSLGGVDGKSISTSSISEYLSINPASVTEMIKKLSEKDLVNYKRSHGASLTRQGKDLAINIVRKHRLWETFLFEKLGFSWDEIHEIAEQLEHIKSDELINKLEEFLGFPKEDPHGDPIPDAEGKIESKDQVKLSELNKGEVAVVAGVGNQDTKFLKHLNEIKLSIGSKIKVNQINEFDQSLEVKMDGQNLFFSDKLAAQILVFRE